MQLKNFVKSIKRTNYCQTVIVGGGGNFATASSQSTTTTQSADGTCTTVHETSGVNADGSRFTTRVVRRQTPDGRVFQEQSTSITN